MEFVSSLKNYKEVLEEKERVNEARKNEKK